MNYHSVSRNAFMYLLFIRMVLLSADSFAQSSPPWESPLKYAWSADGTTFTNISTFQDSSGVPSIIKWKGDTLICVFQWFRQPMNSNTWDKVAVKFSYDNGQNWTQPQPIVVNGIPSNYQRPFDPTLAVINIDSLRIFFSSSNGMPAPGSDSIINTYSASGTDGINFTFEPGPRFDHPALKVIDPAGIYFNGSWQYAAPKGAPQDGAFHCNSSDGIHFIQLADYLSDPMHNWTGNFMQNDSAELRFYGCGQNIWYNSSNDGLNWQGYVTTNLIGGDPSVAKISPTSYLIVYTGQPYSTSINEGALSELSIFPNPASCCLILKKNDRNNYKYEIFSVAGVLEKAGQLTNTNEIEIESLTRGNHLLHLWSGNSPKTFHFVKD